MCSPGWPWNRKLPASTSFNRSYQCALPQLAGWWLLYQNPSQVFLMFTSPCKHREMENGSFFLSPSPLLYFLGPDWLGMSSQITLFNMLNLSTLAKLFPSLTSAWQQWWRRMGTTKPWWGLPWHCVCHHIDWVASTVNIYFSQFWKVELQCKKKKKEKKKNFSIRFQWGLSLECRELTFVFSHGKKESPHFLWALLLRALTSFTRAPSS